VPRFQQIRASIGVMGCALHALVQNQHGMMPHQKSSIPALVAQYVARHWHPERAAQMADLMRQYSRHSARPAGCDVRTGKVRLAPAAQLIHGEPDARRKADDFQ